MIKDTLGEDLFEEVVRRLTGSEGQLLVECAIEETRNFATELDTRLRVDPQSLKYPMTL